jgi:hypothetical protein
MLSWPYHVLKMKSSKCLQICVVITTWGRSSIKRGATDDYSIQESHEQYSKKSCNYDGEYYYYKLQILHQIKLFSQTTNRK